MKLQQELAILNTYIINPETVYNTVLYIGIPFLVVLILIIILSILINRIKSDNILKEKNKWNTDIDTLLTEILFINISTAEIKLKIEDFKKNKPINKKWFKDQILYKLIDIKQNISNVNAHKVILVYRLFKLQDYTKKLRENNKWYFKSLAIYHYQMLDYKIKKGYIKPLLNHESTLLRSNALIALISLTDEKLNFIKNLGHIITKSDELKIIDAVKNGKTSVPKKISNWLKSENDSVILLAIKLYVIENKNIPTKHIEKLILSPNKRIRRQIILAIRELKITGTNNLLISAFNSENNIRNKISIIKTLGLTGDENTLVFFQTILKEEKNIDIIFECIKSHHLIQKIEKIEKGFYINIEESTLDNIELHIKNPYLN
ncbi:MAG: HEAT repeat domain-containing protein [Flavobacterium sp.]|jgi:hypothetical protein